MERGDVKGLRRLSQAIAEGDGISVIAEVADSDAARSAEEQGAEALVVARAPQGVREATTLPLLWGAAGPSSDAARAGVDAWCLVVSEVDEDDLEAIVAEALQIGLECVVEVRDEEQLRLALERLDPEIFLLSSRSAEEDEDPLDCVLAMLPDVPAGKLAIADVPVETREDVVALERAGIDGVIVRTQNVAELVGGSPPEV